MNCKKKILFADLDGTLIDTISGNTFPKGIWDMQFKWDVLGAIKEYGFDFLFIVSNQGGIEQGFVNEQHFEGKIDYIQLALIEYLSIPVKHRYCISNNKSNPFRKPNTGMLEDICHNCSFIHNITLDKNEMLMIGDASGKEGQFSDSDKKTAENFGIDYFDIEDFKQFVEINKSTTKL
ncbi:MAG: HAD-IIIA family hydrolase [Bacilli bacterium]|nr:HAD-IIIA family hydrolase [Bacilli bacterium]